MADSGPSSGTGPPADPDSGVLKLPELLELGWKIFEEVDHTNEPMNSISVQDRVRRGVSALEEAAAMVAQLELFSRNEELEEVATADLRFLLLPALLGALRLKLSDRAGRLQHLHSARELFLDFLRRCKDYGLCKSDLPEPEAGSPESETEPGHAAQVSRGAPSSPGTSRHNWAGLLDLCLLPQNLLCSVFSVWSCGSAKPGCHGNEEAG